MKDKLIPALAGFLALGLVATIYFGVNHLMTQPTEFEQLKTRVAEEKSKLLKSIDAFDNAAEKLPEGNHKFRYRSIVAEYRLDLKQITEIVEKYTEGLPPEGSPEATIQLEYALDCLKVGHKVLDVNQKLLEVQLTFVSR